MTKTWNGGTANWTSANWTPSGQPGSGDAVVVATGEADITSNVGTVSSVDDSSTIALLDGGDLTTTLGFTNSDNLDVDSAFQQGGSTLTVGGALINSGTISIGAGGSLTGNAVVTAASLTNFINSTYGNINLDGEITSTPQATLNVGSVAGAGGQGVIYGNISLAGHALLEFKSGEINTIAASSTLSLSGQYAFVADSGSLTSNSALTGLSTITGTLNLQGTKGSTGGGGQSFATTGAVTVSGNLNVDAGYQQGGTLATIGGADSTPFAALTISGNLRIGNSGSQLGATTLETSAITNYVGVTLGAITLSSVSSADPDYLVTLDVTSGSAGFGAAGSVYGNVYVGGDSLIEFQTGSLSTIAASSNLTLNGANAFVADANALTSNSALTGLATITGTFEEENGAQVSTTGAMTIAGAVDVDYGYLQGGSTLKVGGVSGALISNSGTLNIGDGANQTAATNVTASAITNYIGITLGTINVSGNTASSLRATFTVAGVAGFALTGRLYGSVNLSGDSLIDFAGGGQINLISASSELTLDGSSAYLASGASTSSNSALAGLTTVTGTLNMENGAVVTTSSAVTITGVVNVDAGYAQGGSTLNIGTGSGAAITNEGELQIGSGGSATDPALVTAASLVNVGGTINLSGNLGSPVAETATLDLGSAAGLNGAGQLVGNVNLYGYSLLEFKTGEITTIAANSKLILNSAYAFVADSNSTGSNSALTGLATVAGNFYLQDGANVTTSSLTITGTVNVDYGYDEGGSTLTVTHAVVNSGYLEIGSGAEGTASTTVNVGSLTNSSGSTLGTVTLSGNNGMPVPTLATLSVGTAAGALVGNYNLSGYALLEYTTGSVTSIASGGELTINGANAYVANASDVTSNSALLGLKTVAGSLYVQSGASITTNSGLGVTGTLNVDDGYEQGLSTVMIGGALAITGGSLLIGAGGSSIGASTVDASSLSNSGSVLINTTGTLNLGSGTYTQTAGTTHIEGALIASALSLSGGTFEIGAGATFTSSVDFTAGGATLQLDDPSQFSQPITGFRTGDTIDFVGVAYSASDHVSFVGNGSRTGGTVTVDNSSGVAVASFVVDGDYQPSQFTLSNDGGNLAVVGAAGLTRPTADDFNGDGVADILWRDNTGADSIWDLTPSGGRTAVNPGTVSTSYVVAGVADFNNDGIADIFWRDATTGADVIWDMTPSGGHTAVNPGTVSNSYTVAAVGDFNGDGFADIIWRDTATGALTLWDLNASGGHTSVNLGTVAASEEVAGVGDFNGDGISDILWRNTATGADSIWDMNASGGHTTVNPGTVSTSYVVAGIGDFNGDGISDILWRDTATGADSIWDLTASGGRTVVNPGTVATNYQVAAVEDFNGDGIADILWRDPTTGADSIWDMTASGGHTAVNPGTVASSWKVAT